MYTMRLSGAKRQGNTASHTRDKNNYQLLITLKVGDNDTKEKQKKRGKEKKYHDSISLQVIEPSPYLFLQVIEPSPYLF